MDRDEQVRSARRRTGPVFHWLEVSGRGMTAAMVRLPATGSG
jgi:hypothetical protein